MLIPAYVECGKEKEIIRKDSFLHVNATLQPLPGNSSSRYRLSRAPFMCLSMMEVGCKTNLLINEAELCFKSYS